MGWLSKVWRWLVLNWKYDACAFCAEQTIPKDDDRSYAFIVPCAKCDPSYWQ